MVHLTLIGSTPLTVSVTAKTSLGATVVGLTSSPVPVPVQETVIGPEGMDEVESSQEALPP